MPINAPKGTFDILPDAVEEWQDSSLWQWVERVVTETCRLYNFGEIRTPMFERTELFQRGVGQTSDIVSKEMYTFEDKAKRLMSLRPEGTAPVVRAVLEHRLEQQGRSHKLFYVGPMFRYERQQAGRYRQHHQFGAEIIGSGAPEHDAELIDLLWTVLKRLGLKGLTLQLNSLGDTEARVKFRQALIDYLQPRVGELSADSQTRFELNPLRILDSKNEGDQAIVAEAPSILDFLNDAAAQHFEQVQTLLQHLEIPFVINHRLVRGLDYYNRTVFEITAEQLGAQNSLGGGGRYDDLFKMLGGPDLPALGFGAGIERIIQTVIAQNAETPPPARPKLLFIPLGEAAKQRCFLLAKQLREKGVAAETDLSGKKLQKAMSVADSLSAEFVAVIGDEELKSETCEVKDMEQRESQTLRFDELSNV
jgi:histidyl-tRNA synthetase